MAGIGLLYEHESRGVTLGGWVHTQRWSANLGGGSGWLVAAWHGVPSGRSNTPEVVREGLGVGHRGGGSGVHENCRLCGRLRPKASKRSARRQSRYQAYQRHGVCSRSHISPVALPWGHSIRCRLRSTLPPGPPQIRFKEIKSAYDNVLRGTGERHAAGPPVECDDSTRYGKGEVGKVGAASRGAVTGREPCRREVVMEGRRLAAPLGSFQWKASQHLGTAPSPPCPPPNTC